MILQMSEGHGCLVSSRSSRIRRPRIQKTANYHRLPPIGNPADNRSRGHFISRENSLDKSSRKHISMLLLFRIINYSFYSLINLFIKFF